MIKKNICEFVKVPKVFRKEMRVLSREEQKNLITASRNHRLGIVVILDTPKTENSFRIIPLIDEMITELKAHKKIQNKEKHDSGSAYSNKNIYILFLSYLS